MRVIFAIGCLVLLQACSTTSDRSRAPSASNATFAHKVLSAERKALAVQTDILAADDFRPQFAFIDKLTAAAGDAMRAEKIDLKKARTDKAEATRALQTIDNVFIEQNLLLYIHTTLLSDGLRPGATSSPQWQYNAKRQAHYDNNPTAMYYRFDCDTGSYLILGIADALSLPIRFVEVRGHNFVRWRFDNGGHLNWDTNTAVIHSDNEFRRGESATAGSFTKEQEQSQRYLTDMSEDEIMGYHSFLIAARLESNDRIKLAHKYYKKAIRLRPHTGIPQNYLAEMYLTNKEFAKKSFARKALRLALEAVKSNPDKTSYLDTLSCAYAATGDFKRAEEIEKTGRRLYDKIVGFRNKRTCLDLILASDWTP